jgi:hypothetical protein
MPTVHRLKTWPAQFARVACGDKTFEVRRDDRAYQAGDALELVEWDPFGTPNETGRQLTVDVLFVMPGGEFGVEKGFVVMSLGPPRDGVGCDEAPAAWAPYAKGKCRDCRTFRQVDRDNRCRTCVVGEEAPAHPCDLDGANVVFERACAAEDNPLADAAQRVIHTLSTGEAQATPEDWQAVADALTGEGAAS